MKLFPVDEHYSTEGTENEKGSGLVLIPVKDLALRHGGDVGVRSIEND